MPNDNTGGWPDAEREAVEWALAVHFSQNRQPCMSGDPRDRLSSLQRRKMEDARDAVLGALAPLIAVREAAAAMAMRDAAAEGAAKLIGVITERSEPTFIMRDAIRALPLPDAAQAALDAVVREAVEREREACAAMFDANALWAEAAIAAAIRARGSK